MARTSLAPLWKRPHKRLPNALLMDILPKFLKLISAMHNIRSLPFRELLKMRRGGNEPVATFYYSSTDKAFSSYKVDVSNL